MTVRPVTPVAPSRRRALQLGVFAVLVGIAGAVGGWLIFGATSGPPEFVIRHQGSGEVIHTRPMALGEKFHLEHTHSVTGRLVVETFSIRDATTVAQEDMWFDRPGPNLPTGPEPLGDGETTFRYENGAYRVLHHGHPIGAVPILVGSESVDHTLTFEDGERVRLLEIARAAAAVELAVRAR